MHAHTEAARTALAVLKQCKAITSDHAFSLERSINMLDRELHEAHTALVQAQSMADPIVPQLLPDGYWTRRTHYEPGERKLLESLYAAQGRPLRRTMLAGVVSSGRTEKSESDDYSRTRILDQRVWHVRKKLKRIRRALEAEGLPSHLNTHWAEGFSLTHKPIGMPRERSKR